MNTEEVKFDQYQKVVLESYNGGEHGVVELFDVPNCGDGLLRFLLVELSEQEDCDSFDCAINRLETGIRQLTGVKLAFEAKTLSED